jgi:DNA processing protein
MKSKFAAVKLEDGNYPLLLKETTNPPLSINVSGALPEEGKMSVSVVGTRRATSAGKFLAREISEKLADIGITVVSGLAMGIDTASHEGALLGNGKTLAVLGCGIDIVYPFQNQNLAQKIIESGGAIISEYGPGIPPYPSQFLERNRIVAGLSSATIVIEAPRNSGALVTARLAAEYGREVFVFPGPRNHLNYEGSHKLIRDGARLVSSFENILEDLGIEAVKNKKGAENGALMEKIDGILEREKKIIARAVLNFGEPASIDKICSATKLEPQTVNQNIALLVIEGIIKEGGGKYSI